jgi:hypothetical protein
MDFCNWYEPRPKFTLSDISSIIINIIIPITYLSLFLGIIIRYYL